MFNFQEIEDGSEERFQKRVEVWEGKRPFDPGMVSEAPNPENFTINPRGLPRAKHFLWWLIHNCVAHPVIGIAPTKRAFNFHDWTSRKLNGL